MFISKIKEVINLPHDSVIYIIRIKIILCRNKIWKFFSGSALYSTKQNSCCACATIAVLILTLCDKNDGVNHIVTVFGNSNKKLIIHLYMQFRIHVKHVCLLMAVKWRSTCTKLEDISSSALRHEEAQGTHIIGIMCGTTCIWYFWTTGVFFFVYLSVE